MKQIYQFLTLALVLTFFVACNSNTELSSELKHTKKKKKTQEEKAIATKQRWLHDFNMQKNPLTGKIPKEEKLKEFENALLEKQSTYASRTNTNNYISRGPSNLGGRTRALQVDISDASGKTMLAGGVSSGVFRTTDGGQNWTKVSAFDEIHNVTSIAQDPRPGFQNIWYYGTGEYAGNSASIQEQYRGYGVWKSTDSGLTWQQMATTSNGAFENFDNFFDYIIDMEVHPVSGELFVGTAGKVYRLANPSPVVELEIDNNSLGWTDLEITTSGRVFVAIDGRFSAVSGVWTSPTGSGNWTRISENVTNFSPTRRITLGIAPSNENIVYVLYDNGDNNAAGNRVAEADLFQYNFSTDTWVDYSSKLPDEAGESNGNDPFSIQGGYDLVVSVKPDNENFVVIGGTNIYKINNITTDTTFKRIGGYKDANGYELYSNHHPDIHAVAWGLTDSNILYSGTDGGVHETTNVSSETVSWNNLNNNYLTYQYYHINMMNESGSDIVIGGAQDNGTTIGGTNFGRPDKSSMKSYFGGDGAAVAVANSDNLLSGFYVYASTQNGNMYRGEDTFLNSNITPKDENGDEYDSGFVTYFHMDPDNSEIIYYAGGDKLLRTDNAETVSSSTWDEIGKLPFGEKILTMETTRGTYDASSSFLFIGGRGGNVYRVSDPKNTSEITLKKMTPPGVFVDDLDINNSQYISDIAIHPTNSDILIATYASYGSTIKNIFITKNATAASPTWVEVERNLASHSIRSAAIAMVGDQTHYFVGTARGLYSSENPETEDWSLEGGTVMGIPIVSGLVYRHSDNVLLVGTHGNGMFETNLNSSLSVKETYKETVQLAMYPNPTQRELTLISRDITIGNSTKFSIYSIDGKEVKRGVVQDKKIDVQDLSQGMYLLNLKSDGKTVTRKFVKN
ncbi:T9SS type A sorting domain-containing protein [Polaribacter tangerinus]|uniref:T9SS type A sorting domain-containing protein n=1 Tax=Polaribacter tangerinus TaxID=1920034 RepID=UPI000B4BD92C|nr:T9SS type A sorting domain-containing protein [Polaribacter tangerinus]